MTFEKPTGREVRVASDAWPTTDFEIRADGEGMTFRGYAAVFNSQSEDLGGFRETIAPGAFSRTLKRDTSAKNVRMFLNHNTDVLLASTRANTLRLSEDDKGLMAEADLPNTSAGRDAAELLRRGDIHSMSFGFQTVKDTWTSDAERTLQEIRLFEVSPITGWPAYPATTATVRHLADLIDAPESDTLDALRVLGAADDKLTPEQKDLILRLVNAKSDTPLVAASIAAWRERLAARSA